MGILITGGNNRSDVVSALRFYGVSINLCENTGSSTFIQIDKTQETLCLTLLDSLRYSHHFTLRFA